MVKCILNVCNIYKSVCETMSPLRVALGLSAKCASCQNSDSRVDLKMTPNGTSARVRVCVSVRVHAYVLSMHV